MRIISHYNRLKRKLAGESVELSNSNENEGCYQLQETINQEVEDTTKVLDKIIANNKILTEEICELNKNLFETTERIDFEKKKHAEQARSFRGQICEEKTTLLEKQQDITSLTNMLEVWIKE